MIPKTHALILGILCERPLSPYEMIKYFENVNLKYWFPVSDPTFYATLKKLSREGLVSGTVTRAGKNPEKTIYTITPQGQEKVIAAFLEFLTSGETDPVMLPITIIFLHHIPRETVLEALRQRRDTLLGRKAGGEMRYEAVKDNELLPYNARIVIRYALYSFETELRITEELLESVTKDTAWSPVPMAEAFVAPGKAGARKAG